VLAAIACITEGNVRLLQRLFAQIACLLDSNQLGKITAEVVQAARESLVIGLYIGMTKGDAWVALKGYVYYVRCRDD